MTEPAPSSATETSTVPATGALPGTSGPGSSSNPSLPEFSLTWKQHTKSRWWGSVSHVSDNIASNPDRIHWIQKPPELLATKKYVTTSFDDSPLDIPTSEPEYIHFKHRYGFDGTEPPFFEVRIVLMPSDGSPFCEIHQSHPPEGWVQHGGDEGEGTVVYCGIKVQGHSRLACVVRGVSGRAEELALDSSIEDRDDDVAHIPADSVE